MGWLHFLNLQYWYCIIYSMFGGECAYLEEIRAEQEAAKDLSNDPTFFELFFGPFFSGLGVIGDTIVTIVSFVWSVYSALAWSVSAFLFFAILSALAGLFYIRFRELYTFGTLPPEEEKKEDPRRNRWEELLEYTKSTDPKLWRQAILEADHMLGELLGGLGYEGVNTAEKMKLLPEDAFVTVPVAWEAHRIRNFVSQGASDFILTQREAFRVMKLYEQVFEEFQYV